MFTDKDTLGMYEILAGIAKSTVNTLKYPLTWYLKYWTEF